MNLIIGRLFSKVIGAIDGLHLEIELTEAFHIQGAANYILVLYWSPFYIALVYQDCCV